MAASLKDIRINRLRDMMAAVACMFCFAGISFAEEMLNDPTRPAIELVPGLSGGANGAEQAPPQGLQSVIISPKREAAIINGVEVEVGEKYDDAVLAVVNETCVVLTGSQGRQVMHMFPTVSMSKNELACAKRQGMQPMRKAASKPAATNKARKKARAGIKKRAVTCVADENKNGSGK